MGALLSYVRNTKLSYVMYLEHMCKDINIGSTIQRAVLSRSRTTWLFSADFKTKRKA